MYCIFSMIHQGYGCCLLRSTMNLTKHNCSHLTEEARSVHLFTIHDFSVTSATVGNHMDYCCRSRCCVDGYPWEIRLYPTRIPGLEAYFIVLELVFLGEPRGRGSVTATLKSRLVEYLRCTVEPINYKRSKTFRHSSDSTLVLLIGYGVATDVQQVGNSLTVECTISVLRDPSDDIPNCLHPDLGDLLESQVGADVTLAVSGESIPAHKNILAPRSPVFMAEFFGSMAERSSQPVEIKDMDAQVFRAMIRFIYTGMVPEFDNQTAAGAGQDKTAIAQHLLVAAGRYGLDRLKVIHEQRLAVGIDVETAASTLALADQHNCAGLKAKCIEFIAGSSDNLDAVLDTEGYRYLEESSPSVLTELLKAANGRSRKS